MRASAQPNSAVVEKLGMHFIRVMEDGTEPSGDNPMIKVVAPSGKVGFVPADAISPLGNDAICYAKEGGAWKISGFLGGESVSHRLELKLCGACRNRRAPHLFFMMARSRAAPVPAS